MIDKCKFCKGEMKPSSNFQEGSEEVCFMVCRNCEEIDEESIVYG